MANTSIEMPAERKIGKRRMSPFRWAATIGWKHVIGLAVVVYSLFPILYIISVAFSDSGDVTSGLFGTFTTKNFEQLFAGDDPDRPFVQWIINTVWIASVSSIGSVFLSALAAYSFSRQRFRGRRSGLLALILLQMFPSVLGLVAIYAILSELYKYIPALGLNSPWGLILVYLGGSLGGGTYLMYGFFNTVPKEIEKLAGTFQRNALRIAAQGEAKQHVDIEYRALSVQARDREHAIFNALRYYEARTAIVFCKTRANVNHLFARMGNRGFQVVALSGELSQTERMHALQALRDGRARVCIATDVAARGIDLPGLELVIHADLPSNSETLLHRSGRTGRAGQKGVSALIVPPAEYRKAQRLLQGAKVVAEWGKAPSAEEVQAKDDLRLMEHPALSVGVGD